MLVWITLFIGIAVSVLFGVSIGRDMNAAIARCLAIKDLHDDIACGAKKLPDISNIDLLSLSRPCFTIIGMGGIGPAYTPSISIWRLVQDELAKRRSVQTNTRHER